MIRHKMTIHLKAFRINAWGDTFEMMNSTDSLHRLYDYVYVNEMYGQKQRVIWRGIQG